MSHAVLGLRPHTWPDIISRAKLVASVVRHTCQDDGHTMYLDTLVSMFRTASCVLLCATPDLPIVNMRLRCALSVLRQSTQDEEAAIMAFSKMCISNVASFTAEDVKDCFLMTPQGQALRSRVNPIHLLSKDELDHVSVSDVKALLTKALDRANALMFLASNGVALNLASMAYLVKARVINIVELYPYSIDVASASDIEQACFFVGRMRVLPLLQVLGTRVGPLMAKATPQIVRNIVAHSAPIHEKQVTHLLQCV